MFNISKYLEKFSKNIQSGELQNKQIIDVIKNKTDISLNQNDIEIRNNILYINSSPAVKNKIFIYKEEIIKTLNVLSPIKFLDIR